MNITMAHGSGGESTSRLISDIFSRYFNNEYLSALEDSAVVPGSNRLAMTTDSFVVTPIIFPGGDIGRLSVCGTVNDLLMSGSIPKYITCGCILEEGLDIDELERIVSSMSETAREAGVIVVTGDTKVVERHSEHPGLIINTSGVGFIPEGLEVPGPAGLKDKDVIILSGNLGDHHAAILGARMGIESGIVSDNAPLCEMVRKLMDGGVRVHAMRDVTRGGLGTVLNEFASASFCSIELEEKELPIVQGLRDDLKDMGIAPEGYDDIKNFAKALDKPIKSKTGKTYVEIPNPERTLPIIKKVMNKVIAAIEKTRELTKKVKNQMGKARVSVRAMLKEAQEEARRQNAERKPTGKKKDISR